MDIRYTRDGDMIPSKFARIFGIDRYDDDFREAKYFKEPLNNINKILENFSYDHILIKYFKGVVGDNLTQNYNTIILLYNFDYDGEIREYSNGNEMISFIGKTKYKNLYT
ncbi:immunity 22 family protein [Clostridium punense]|nr:MULTISPECIES: immunity 22 family protein [Clostridium]